jgi:hypothetical protein
MHTISHEIDLSETHGCWLQVGVASWDRKYGNEGREKSVRAYYERVDGGFSRSSPEVPIAWLLPMLQAALQSGLAKGHPGAGWVCKAGGRRLADAAKRRHAVSRRRGVMSRKPGALPERPYTHRAPRMTAETPGAGPTSESA